VRYPGRRTLGTRAWVAGSAWDRTPGSGVRWILQASSRFRCSEGFTTTTAPLPERSDKRSASVGSAAPLA
jgi:hypothetical protein